MKTWWQYILEEAEKYGLTIVSRGDAWDVKRNTVAVGTFGTSQEVEAFILGVWWARSGE